MNNLRNTFFRNLTDIPKGWTIRKMFFFWAAVGGGGEEGRNNHKFMQVIRFEKMPFNVIKEIPCKGDEAGKTS